MLPLLRHDVTLYVADFLPNGAHNNNNNGGLRRVDDRVTFNHRKPDYQIKLNNDFSNLILFSRVPWFIVY